MGLFFHMGYPMAIVTVSNNYECCERDRHFDDLIDYCEESDSSDDDDEEYQNYQVEWSHEIEALRNIIAASLMNASN